MSRATQQVCTHSLKLLLLIYFISFNKCNKTWVPLVRERGLSGWRDLWMNQRVPGVNGWETETEVALRRNKASATGNAIPLCTVLLPPSDSEPLSPSPMRCGEWWVPGTMKEMRHRDSLYCYHDESIPSPMGNPQPLDASHVLFFSTFTLVARLSRSLFFFFLLAATRDLLIVIHLYLCLRLSALIWSLPHFQVRVIMFSAPDSPLPLPKPLVSRARGEERSRSLLFLERQ